MKFILFLVGVVFIMATVFCADCEYKGKSLTINETYVKPGTCYEVICTAKDDMRAIGCPKFDAPPPCRTVEDNSKPYPNCCAEPLCPGDKGY